MTIIEKVENVGIKVHFIRQMGKSVLHKIEKKDLEIINSHKFEIDKSSYKKFVVTARCKECGAEADFEDDTIYCFLNSEDKNIQYASCSNLIMSKALE